MLHWFPTVSWPLKGSYAEHCVSQITPTNSLPIGETRVVWFSTPTPCGELMGQYIFFQARDTLSRVSYQPIVLASLWSHIWSPAANKSSFNIQHAKRFIKQINCGLFIYVLGFSFSPWQYSLQIWLIIYITKSLVCIWNTCLQMSSYFHFPKQQPKVEKVTPHGVSTLGSRLSKNKAGKLILVIVFEWYITGHLFPLERFW